METDLSRVERFRQFKQEIRGNERYLIVGIDVAKDRHHAFLGTANWRTVLRRLAVENSRTGFEHLSAHVQFQLRKHGLNEVVFGVEPTSVYHKPLAEYLIEDEFLVVYVTNAAIKQNRQLLDGRWDKNDTKDAANVVEGNNGKIMPLVGTVLLPRSGDAFLTHGADEEGLKLNPLLFYPMARLPPRASLLTDLAIIATRDAGETSAPRSFAGGRGSDAPGHTLRREPVSRAVFSARAPIDPCTQLPARD